MSPYLKALRDAMSLCAARPNSIIMGQSVLYGGTALRRTLDHIPDDKLLELPVFENTQAGMALGIALAGMLPICCFPRWNFALAAADQIVNHIDKFPIYGNGYNPRVIIRVAVPTGVPLDPGPQHLGNFASEFRSMLRTMSVVELNTCDQIVPAYKHALENDRSSIMVEFTGFYDD